MDFKNKFTHPIFKNFTQDEINYLLKISQTLTEVPGKVLIHEGDVGQEIYLVLEGEIEVHTVNEISGKVIKLATLGSGSVVGEISVITNNVRSATVTVVQESKILLLDVSIIKADVAAQPIYKKLLQNLTVELSKKLIYSGNKLVKCDTEEQYVSSVSTAQTMEAPNAIAVLFGWKWFDIMHEVPFLAAHGYDAIKISPPQEFVVRKGNPWWEIYQPVSYFLSQFYGSEENLIKMVDFCHGYNIKVYVDLILNHMAEFVESESEHVGTNGHEFSKYNYQPLNKDNDSYSFDDFYHFADQGNKTITNEDYCGLHGVWHLEHYDLLNLPKLDLDNSHVISVLRKYVRYLLSLGVDGFRIDAAKHLKTKAVEKILAGLKTKSGAQPFIYQEYYTGAPMGIDIYSFMEKYFRLGYVTAFEYGDFLSNAVCNKGNNLEKLIRYSFGSSWVHYPDNRAVVVLDNHDTERMMPNILNYKNSHNNSYVLAYIFMLAWPFGIPKIMSSFKFSWHDDSIPAEPIWQKGRNSCFDKDSPWVAQHRWNAIANMVLFRRKTKDAVGITHVWTNGNQVAFARTSKSKEYVAVSGFVVINDTDQPLKRRFDTGLPKGKYCDFISGELVMGKMSGAVIDVEEYGFADIEVKPFDAVAIVVGFVV